GSAACEILFVGQPQIAQVDVSVNEPRQCHQSSSWNLLVGSLRNPSCDPLNPSVFYEDRSSDDIFPSPNMSVSNESARRTCAYFVPRALQVVQGPLINLDRGMSRLSGRGCLTMFRIHRSTPQVKRVSAGSLVQLDPSPWPCRLWPESLAGYLSWSRFQ